MELPLVMRITALGHPPILVDPRHNAYDGGPDDDAFPEAPALVLVETQLVGPDAGPAFTLPGRDLDALLWRIGLQAFPGRAAHWLTGLHRVRLTRWPNLTAIDCSFEHVSMAALLANSAFTAAELAEASGCPLGQAHDVINALSLMGVLYVEPAQAEEPVTPAVAPADAVVGASVSPEVTDASATTLEVSPPASTHQSLLSRLRLRFGI